MRQSRFISRTIDYSIFYTLLLTLHFPYVANLVLLLTTPLLFAPIEALLYYLTKTTPGKWIFGISLSKKLNLYSSFKLAFKKAFLVLPLLLSPLNIFYAIFYIRENREFKKNRWDKFEDTRVIQSNRQGFLKFICLFIFCFSMLYNYVPAKYTKHLIDITSQQVSIDSWVKVKDDNLKFSVYFPSKPKVEEKSIEVTDQNTTLEVTEFTHSDDVNYSLVSSPIPSSWTLFGSKYLFNAMCKPLEKHQGKVVSKEMCIHGGYPAMNYLLDNNGDKGQTKGTLILVKSTIYKIEVHSKKTLSQEQLKLADEFINSFDVN